MEGKRQGGKIKDIERYRWREWEWKERYEERLRERREEGREIIGGDK